MSKLSIGTVQFGLDYGIANSAGKVPIKEAQKILREASLNHINMIDTAAAYGDSEKMLGKVGVNDFHVVTKLPELTFSKSNVSVCVESIFLDSLRHLNVPKVYGLLLHCPLQLLTNNGQALYKAMLNLKEQGLVEKIGISVYQPEELDALFSEYDFDLVQVPFNIMDRRLIDSGWLLKLKEKGVEVHARSIFLQGLLLMPYQHRPEKFKLWDDLWRKWDGWLQEHNLTPLEASIRYALSVAEISNVIVGVNSKTQLKQIITAMDGTLPEIPSEIFSDDINLLNPAKWSSL
ncbi:MAG: aldo/keto reductase [Mariprofundaceae bacterium]|nr:aldo/keto reductase [Mariprofundaceae bacterium]